MKPIKKKRKATEMSLQITSMADIFMILLVFLLKNYAASITSIAPTTHLTLPEVLKANAQVQESLKVEISRNNVVVDDKPVLRLNNFSFEASETSSGDASPTLEHVFAHQRKLLPVPNLGSGLVVMADQQTPYSTLKRVVASAAGAGFVDLQLVVVETE